MSMEAHAVEQMLLDLLRGQYSNLTLGYNDHAANYQTALEAEQRGEFNHVEWVSQQQKEVALRNNTVWILHWYPDTPVAFCSIAGATLASCLEFAKK
jgi:hypothetical protein